MNSELHSHFFPQKNTVLNLSSETEFKQSFLSGDPILLLNIYICSESPDLEANLDSLKDINSMGDFVNLFNHQANVPLRLPYILRTTSEIIWEIGKV